MQVLVLAASFEGAVQREAERVRKNFEPALPPQRSVDGLIGNTSSPLARHTPLDSHIWEGLAGRNPPSPDTGQQGDALCYSSARHHTVQSQRGS
jgi:hypothetical protein